MRGQLELAAQSPHRTSERSRRTPQLPADRGHLRLIDMAVLTSFFSLRTAYSRALAHSNTRGRTILTS